MSSDRELRTEHDALKQRYTRAIGCFSNLVEQARRDHRAGNGKYVGQDLDALAEAVARFAEMRPTQWAEPCEAPRLEEETVHDWQIVFRRGVVPLLSATHLEALGMALETDDPRLLQGATTNPPPLNSVRDRSVEGACAIGFCGWAGDGLKTVGEVEDFFARICFLIDEQIGEPMACRKLLNWFDDTPRNVMRHQLLGEVRLALEDRRRREESRRLAASVEAKATVVHA